MKKYNIVLFILTMMFISIVSVKAEDYCTKRWREEFNSNPDLCGRVGNTCSWNKETKICEINQHDQNLWDAEECAKNSKNESECSKCTGYYWSESTNTCGSTPTNDSSDNDTYNNYSDAILSCGDGMITNIPSAIPKVISIVYKLIQFIVPVLLIIFGMIDLVKGITAQKEDEIKKGQQIFIKRLVTGVVVFFIFVFVKLFVSLLADGNSASIMDCVECFIANKCDSSSD